MTLLHGSGRVHSQAYQWAGSQGGFPLLIGHFLYDVCSASHYCVLSDKSPSVVWQLVGIDLFTLLDGYIPRTSESRGP